MNISSSFGADTESPEAFQPGEGAFDRPADFAQAGTVLDAAASDDRRDAACANETAVLVVVVAAVGVEPARSTTWLVDHAADRRDGVDQRNQLGDVIAVPAGQCDGQRDTGGVGDQVML